VTKWLLERVDRFPKNQRFVFGQRLADRALNILEVLVQAAYSPRKVDLLARASNSARRRARSDRSPSAGDAVLFTRGVVHTFTAPLDDLTLLSYHAPFFEFDDTRQFTIPRQTLYARRFAWSPSRLVTMAAKP
jgi:hypothetical protein